jgi:hypothetical protein
MVNAELVDRDQEEEERLPAQRGDLLGVLQASQILSVLSNLRNRLTLTRFSRIWPLAVAN